MKVSIIGQGDIVLSVASAICQLSLVAEVMLVDTNRRVYCGVLQDLRAAIASMGSDTKVLSANNLGALVGSEIIVLLPSLARFKWAQAQRSANAALVRQFAHGIKRHTPTAKIVVATPPAATMAFIMYRELGAEPRQVIGHCGSIANANLKTLIADKLGVSAWDVTTLVIGNDGTVFPLFQYCCVNGIPIDQLLNTGQDRELMEAVNDKRNQALVSHSYNLSVSLSQIVATIAVDKKRIMTVSSLIKVDTSEVYLNVPTKIGRNGAEEIVQLNLTNSQREQFTKLVARSITEQQRF
jgi:malate dehydrogenase